GITYNVRIRYNQIEQTYHKPLFSSNYYTFKRRNACMLTDVIYHNSNSGKWLEDWKVYNYYCSCGADVDSFLNTDNVAVDNEYNRTNGYLSNATYDKNFPLTLQLSLNCNPTYKNGNYSWGNIWDEESSGKYEHDYLTILDKAGWHIMLYKAKIDYSVGKWVCDGTVWGEFRRSSSSSLTIVQCNQRLPNMKDNWDMAYFCKAVFDHVYELGLIFN
ncbi:MAG: hypothetical protein ACI4PF_00885, partial [Christensenellales bacterium]